MIASTKSDYEANLALTYVHSNNNRTFQYISNIKGQDHYPIEMSYNDTTESNDSEKAEIFNEYFYSVFTRSNPEFAEDNVDITSTTGILNDNYCNIWIWSAWNAYISATKQSEWNQ